MPCCRGRLQSGTSWASAGCRQLGVFMDFGLNEEQRAIVATVRDFVRRELVPHEDLVERLDEVPADLASQIRGRAIAAGLYAANFPPGLGGGGLDQVAVTLGERELGGP